MKVAIAGFDIEGKASYRYFKSLGADITICDQKTDIVTPEGVKTQLGEDYLDNLGSFDLIIRTPGLHPNKILAKNPSVKDKITSCTNEFLKVCPTKNVIGVTGTKGKGTTSTLIAEILTTAGKTVHLGGNIGRAALDMLPDIKPEDWVVLELSSFQLKGLGVSPHIAVCLMTVPEHLNWHEDFEDYVYSKANLFRHQNEDDIAIFFAPNATSSQISFTSKGHKIPFFVPNGAVINNDTISIDGIEICKSKEIKLIGKHNLQNVCAAITAAWQATQDIDVIHSAVVNFAGLPHRITLLKIVNGVKYYDDSFGTTPETAIVAIEAFDNPIVLILGGSSKGASYDQLAKVVKNSFVKKVLLIGQEAENIKDALGQAGFKDCIDGGKNMKEIVNNARNVAEKGDIVLFSTACASFGMFKNYKDRAAQFIEAVESLS